MIVYDLECRPLGHRFEGWFGSSDDFDGQCARGLVTCPACGSADVAKAAMAPAVARKGNQAPLAAPAPTVSADAPAAATAPAQNLAAGPLPPELLTRLATMQAEALRHSRWVGRDFAEASRAMHYGERKVETIHGQASPDEARLLADEGIAVVPLPFPVAPPDDLN